MVGRIWERMVRSVKRCLRKCIGRTSLTFDELATLLIEIEAVINNRPLTYLQDDRDGVISALCPSDLINGRRITSTPNEAHHEVISTHQTLTRKMKHHRALINQFTQRWRKEYLLSLREKHSIKGGKQTGNQHVKVGDVVILKNDSTKRVFWKMGIVESLLIGQDGCTRAAIVKVANAEKSPKRLKRSIKHLFPLEVHHSKEPD